MKKMIFAALLSTVVLSGSVVSYAATEGENTDSWNEVTGTPDGKGATSQAHVKLIPSDNTTDPTDPIDPSDPNEPGGETGNKGPLTIDNVTPLEFGEHQLVGGASIYEVTSKNPNVQVSDNRGQGQGWTLQVTASAFQDTTDSEKVIKGAVLSFPAGTLKTTEGNVSEKPVVNAINLDTDQPSTQVLMSANAKSGMGTWEDLFDASKLTIKVPAGNFSGDYVSTLTWTMLDTPSA